MNFSPDAKAIGLGFLGFIGGYLVMAVATTISANIFDQPPKWWWTTLNLAMNLLPAVAGFVAAYFARSRPVAQGLIAGGFGVFLFFLVALISSPFNASVPFRVLLAMLIVWLGATFGNYMGSRRGP
jgi:hypothetical protein